MHTDSAIDLHDTDVSFGSFRALDKINLRLPKGKIIGLIGPSGAGKSTLIRVVVGRQKITGGTATIFGLPAGSAKLREQIGYMTQEISVYPDLTVRQNLRYFAVMRGQKHHEIPAVIAGLLQTLDMAAQAGQLAGSLSGGQKQRLSLAVALIGEPKFLVLDEPTVGLDPVLREQIWSLFHKLAGAGATILISSHVMDEAERCDDLVLIRGGKVLAHGTPKDLCARTGKKNVEQSFLSLVEANA